MTDKIAREQVLEVLELNTLQKGMLFHYLNEEKEHLYNVQLAFNIKGPFSTERFREAFVRMQERHEAIRTVFRWKNLSKPLQIFLKDCPLDFLFIDISNRENGDALLTEMLLKDRQERFDLEKLPLRVRIIKTDIENFVLTITHHHILYDGWSTGILLQELFTSYHDGGVSELMPLPSYREVYTSLMANAIAHAGEDIRYWREYMQGYEVRNSFGDQLEVIDSIPAITSFTLAADRLDKFAATHKVTKAAMIYAACGLLLQRYSNRKDVAFGTIVSGRDAAVRGSDKIIGNFINTIPLRLTAESEHTLMEVVQMVSNTLMERTAYTGLPYYELKKALDLRSSDDLFDTVVVIENYPLPDKLTSGEGQEISLRSVYENISFPLVISVFFREEIQVELNYKKDAISDVLAATLAAQLKKLIVAILDTPVAALSSLSLLSVSEEEELLGTFNNTAVPYPDTATVISLFEQQVQLTPDNIALRYEDTVLSYRELNEQSNQVATYLRSSLGIQTGDLVGLMLERELSMIISIFGILKSGGVYVPLSPDYPAERVNYIISDAGLKGLITRRRHLQEGLQLPAALIDLDRDWEDIMAQSHAAPEVSPGSNALAYVIYTSGSTGRPKGVMVEHHSVVNRIAWMQNAYPIDSTDVLLQKTPIVFDVSIWELFWWSFTGASLCLLKPGGEKSRQEIIHTIGMYKVSVIHFVPSMLFSFLSGLDSLDGLNTLRLVFSSGEALKAAYVNLFGQFLHKYVNARLINLYGPTEATVDVSYYECDFKEDNSSIPIGRPIDNIRLHVLDNHGRLQAIGAAGELCIAGVGLARGYINNASLTAEKFIHHPLLGRIYRTGDLASWLPDGNLLYHGRLDDQIKLRGFRIEPGEIAGQLSSHPQVKEAVVISRERGDSHYLVAYYLSAEVLEAGALKTYLSGLLPDYMVPYHYIRLDALPLTGNGKLDRRALPEPELPGTHGLEAASTAMEVLLSGVWCKVLGLAEVGVTDNFFAAGGDSIKSIQISSRLRTLGYDLTVKEVLTVPVIREQAVLLRALTQSADQGRVSGSVPLTPIQQLFFSRWVTDPHHYNQSVMLHFVSGLTADTVGKIFSFLINHHDSLRLVYGAEQTYSDQTAVWLDEHDLRNTTDAASTLSGLTGELQSGIDLSRGPLLRLGLFHLDNGSHLLIVLHHLVVDGVSWRILFEDFTQLHEQLQQGKPLHLPMKTDSFQRWSCGLAAYQQSRYYAAGRRYWSSFPSSSFTLPRDHEQGRNLAGDTSTISFRLDAQQTTQLLTAVHRPFNTRINDILLCGLYLSLQEHYGADRFTIDMEGHGREDLHNGLDTGRTIGWFTTIYPLLLEADATTLSGTIKQLKECVRQVPNHGFDYLLYHHESGHADFRRSGILFNYLGQFDSDTSGHSWSLSTLPRGGEVSAAAERDYDWEMVGLVSGGSLELRLSYSTQQYKSDTIDALMLLYRKHLLALTDYCLGHGKEELSPSDYSYKDLSLAAVEQLQQAYDISDLYELSGMQEGMLFHTLLDKQADHYFEQLSCHVHGPLNITAVSQTLNALVDRYDSLRTVYLHENYDRPLQVVLQQRPAVFSYHDIAEACRTKSGEAPVIRHYQETDRQKKFDLGKDPLLRLQVLKVNATRHVFIWSHHHIVMDGWCMRLLLRDFRLLYNHYANGAALSLPPVRPYGDYIAWLRDQDLSLSSAYWSQYLQGYEGLTGLPRRDILKADGYVQQMHEQELNSSQTAQLNGYCSRHGFTLNTLLQAAWGLLLSRYNNTEDVVFGSVVSGRPAELAGVEEMVGLFINTVPVRVHYKSSETVSDLLRNMQAGMVAGVPYNHYALSSIGSQLFDHIVIVENYPLASELQGDGAGDYTLDNVEIFEQTNYDLCLVVLPGVAIKLQLAYNEEVYEVPRMEAVLSQLVRVLLQMTDERVTHLSEINLLSASEEEELLETFNNTAVPYPDTATVISLFEQQVQLTPDNIALIFGNDRYTYRQLNNLANNIAEKILSSAGTENPGIGLLFSSSVEMIGAILGIQKAGGTYIPLSPAAPSERNAHILLNSNARLLLTQQSLITEASKISHQVLLIEIPENLDKPTLNPVHAGTSESLLYIIYTSGTTGNPKGVEVPNIGVVNYITWRIATYGFTAADVTLQLLPYYFDAYGAGLYAALLSGGALVIMEDAERISPAAIAAVIRKEQVTCTGITPTIYDIVLNELAVRKEMSPLRIVALGGEKIAAEIVQKSKRLLPEVSLHNEYGPTEASVTTTHNYLNETNTDIIGKPISNMEVYILGMNLELLPAGVYGELCIAGAGIANGYTKNEILTQEKFVPHPYRKGKMMYRSGDLACWLPDGNIRLRGRIDNQVKIRGFRIELSEIEEQLNSCPGIQRSVVVVKEKEGEKYLAAYYIAEGSPDTVAIKKHLSAKLPDYMIPGWLIQLQDFPITANGKLDVKALPDLEMHVTESYIAAEGHVEETLVKIWAEILKLDAQKISVDANFFDLGGHSIHMISLTNRVNQQFGAGISVAAMFGMPAIRIIAAHLSNGGHALKEMHAHIEADWQEAENNLEIFNQLHDQ